jgi:hypothetical protein
MRTQHYKANFSLGGLMVPESRIVAGLLLDAPSEQQWKTAIIDDNILRKRSPTTASTQAGLIRARLQTMTDELWQLVHDGSRPVATHAILAATIKYSPLLADFLDQVVRDLHTRFEPVLRPQHWDRFLEDCRNKDEHMPEWSAATLDTLRSRMHGMLAEAGYLSDARRRELRPVSIAPEVIAYLQAHDETSILRSLQVTR